MGDLRRWFWRNAPGPGIPGNLLRWIWRMASVDRAVVHGKLCVKVTASVPGMSIDATVSSMTMHSSVPSMRIAVKECC